MGSWVVKAGFVFSMAAALAGCGGSKSKPGTTVAQVTISPASLSLVAGEVVQVSATALNSSGTPVATTFTFNSSNTGLATVSPGGLVCGGTWDSFFITCKGTDSLGNPVAGTATVTASAQGVSSVPVSITVHPTVTSVVVTQTTGNLFPGCTSTKLTAQFKAQAFHNATDITNLVGTFSWSSSATGVGTVDANGLATSGTPGLAGVFATIGTVSSPAVNFKSCLPVQILLHVNGDAPGSPTTSATVKVTGTTIVEADMTDENGVVTNSAPVSIISNNTEIASVSGSTPTGTMTGQGPGGAGLIAICSPSLSPGCGAGLNTPIYSNLFSVTVTDASGNNQSPATTVYATTSFAPPSGTTSTMIPIDTSKNPPVAGTAINLPGPPNSMVFSPDGTKAYIGTSAGVATFDPNTNVATLVAPFVGKVLAVSHDANVVVLSNAANDPGTGTPIEPNPSSQRLVIFNAANSTVQTFVLPGATSAAFTSDGFKAFVGVNNGNVYVFSPVLSLQTLTFLGGSNLSTAALTSGPFAYLANTGGLKVLGTCNNVQQADVATTSAPQLVATTQNANVIIAVNSNGVDIETATVTPLTAPVNITPANCTPNISYSNQFVDFGLGAFTARQLLVPSNANGGTNGSHIVVIPAGISKVFVAAVGQPGGAIISLAAGGTEALSGGMTLDGNVAWVGVAGSNNVDEINLTNNTDAVQIATSFKKSDGTPAPPNIVVVRPR